MKKYALSMWAVALSALVALTGCSTTSTSSANTQPKYPTKPINLVIAFNAGGPSDVQARALQPALEKALGQKIVFDYKVGAGGAVGFQYLADAPKTGYVIGGINLPHIILEPLAHQGNFKWQDFTYLAESYNDPTVLAVNKNSPIKTLAEFIKDCKTNPGKVTVGGVGVMTGHYLTSYILRDKLKISFQYVPFQGAAPEDAALLGSHVDAMIGNLSDVMRNRSQFRVLAIASAKKSPIDPSIPTFKEQGYNVIASIQRGFAVPKGTPQYIVDKLRTAFNTALHNPAYLKKMQSMGAPIQYLDGPALRKEVSQLAVTDVAELKKFHAIQTQK